MSWALNYFEHFLIFNSAVTGCVSISASGSSVGVPVGITSSAVGLKFAQLLQDLKNISLSSRKREKSLIVLVWIAKTKLNTIKVFYINHDKSVSGNMLREYNEMKKKSKILKML